MKTSKFVVIASSVAVAALAVGAGINLSRNANDTAEAYKATPAPDPVSTASLDPVVVTAKR